MVYKDPTEEKILRYIDAHANQSSLQIHRSLFPAGDGTETARYLEILRQEGLITRRRSAGGSDVWSLAGDLDLREAPSEPAPPPEPVRRPVVAPVLPPPPVAGPVEEEPEEEPIITPPSPPPPAPAPSYSPFANGENPLPSAPPARLPSALKEPKRAAKASHYKGVNCNTKKSKRWSAQLHHNGKLIMLGRYHREEDAARAWDTAARAHGRTDTNFPLEAGAAPLPPPPAKPAALPPAPKPDVPQPLHVIEIVRLAAYSPVERMRQELMVDKMIRAGLAEAKAAGRKFVKVEQRDESGALVHVEEFWL